VRPFRVRTAVSPIDRPAVCCRPFNRGAFNRGAVNRGAFNRGAVCREPVNCGAVCREPVNCGAGGSGVERRLSRRLDPGGSARPGLLRGVMPRALGGLSRLGPASA
jgi:hypothetical protein